ncbi:acyltransferase [Parafrigoribacterium mesophilum]|uniref:acyltransferase n=1 Tax=Parafrigoribacterium mesophilum TaxID=433646 RepID=UPI0031FCD3DA
MTDANIHPTADVAGSASIGAGSKVWQYSHVREDARIGQNCVIGRGVYVGPAVQLGDNCKVQNYALLYEPAQLGDGVFVGPAVVFTNDQFPRAVNPDGTLKSGEDWDAVGVTVLEGAAIGAGSVCIAPVTIGRWSLVGAGSTVVKNVPDFALVVGSPARRIGWVGRSGRRLAEESPGVWVCPVTGQHYRQLGIDELQELTGE